MNVYYYKVTGIDIPFFWKNISKMSVIPGGMMIIGLIFNHYYFITEVTTFLICVIIYIITYSVLMYAFSLNEYEKSTIRNPLQKAIRMLKLRKL